MGAKIGSEQSQMSGGFLIKRRTSNTPAVGRTTLCNNNNNSNTTNNKKAINANIFFICKLQSNKNYNKDSTIYGLGMILIKTLTCNNTSTIH